MVVHDKYFDSYVEKLPSLADKVIAITGCTSGTGYHAAKIAIQKNAKVLLMLNRKSSRATKAEVDMKEEAEKVESQTIIQTVECDLMSFESVRNAAAELNHIVEEHGGLDVLVNNAGIFMQGDYRTEDGFDAQMQVNHLSHFLLTKLVLHSIQKAGDLKGEARIVNHSSVARFLGTSLKECYFDKCEEGTLGGDLAPHKLNRYHMSKLCNSLFTQTLHTKLREHGIENVKVVTADPGLSTTSMLESFASGADAPGILQTVFVKGLNSGLAPVHSARDGTIPLLVASYGTDVNSGNFYQPERFGCYGQPTLVIENALPVHKGTEKDTMDPKLQEMMWDKSEEAINEKFL